MAKSCVNKCCFSTDVLIYGIELTSRWMHYKMWRNKELWSFHEWDSCIVNLLLLLRAKSQGLTFENFVRREKQLIRDRPKDKTETRDKPKDNTEASLLSAATVPSSCKHAIVIPLLKVILDSDDLRNYCPVSNLPFLSRISKNSVLYQLHHHFADQLLLEPFQSA